jgi:hypothetical protein
LQLPPKQVSALKASLARAGTREIGGQIFGEQFAPSVFAAWELTFQKRPGTFARFMVDLLQAAKDAITFHDRTRHDYRRYNYVGEWHSHPSFPVQPSATDVATMRGLVADDQFKGTFAVLMIVRLDPSGLVANAWLFDPRGPEFGIELEYTG